MLKLNKRAGWAKSFLNTIPGRALVGLVLAFLAFTIERVVFILLHFSDVNPTLFIKLLVLGLRFDGVIIGILLFPMALIAPWLSNKWLKKALFGFIMSLLAIAMIANAIDWAYFPYLQKRAQADALLFLNGSKGDEFFTLLPQFLIEYGLLWLLAILIVVYTITILYKKIAMPFFSVSAPLTWPKRLLLSVTGVGVSLLMYRGGLQVKPIHIVQASEMVQQQYAPAVLNTPFSILKTFENKALTPLSWYNEKQLSAADKGIRMPDRTQVFTKKNVVVIVVESLSQSYLKPWGGTAETPFLNQLKTKSTVYNHCYANAQESVKGIPSILAALPAWMDDPVAFSPYANNAFTGYSNLLTQKGYDSYFFHGGHNGTMGFDALSAALGISHYVGFNEFPEPKADDGHWGIWDHAFIPFVAHKLNQAQQPFVATLFTLNTHHPFQLPSGVAPIPLNAKHPILPCLHYTDSALKIFFQHAATMPWYKNTVFVITADHTGPLILGKSYPSYGDYNIPLWFFDPAQPTGCTVNYPCNQIDITAILMKQLAYPSPYFSIGNVPDAKHIAIVYKSGYYLAFDANYVYTFKEGKIVNAKNIGNDVEVALNKIPKTTLEQAEKAIKIKIQLYTNGLLNNTMHLKSNDSVYKPN